MELLEGELIVRGMAANIQSIVKYKAAIENLGIFKSVTLQKITKNAKANEEDSSGTSSGGASGSGSGGAGPDDAGGAGAGAGGGMPGGAAGAGGGARKKAPAIERTYFTVRLAIN